MRGAITASEGEVVRLAAPHNKNSDKKVSPTKSPQRSAPGVNKDLRGFSQT